MARLIDADALILELSERMRSIDNDVICGTVEKPYAYLDCAISKAVSDYLSRCPTIDAEPVRHGRVVWKNRFMGGFVPDITITDRTGEKHTGTLDTTHYEPVPYCSECGKELGVSSLAYCPNCGAKMDGGKDDLL